MVVFEKGETISTSHRFGVLGRTDFFFSCELSLSSQLRAVKRVNPRSFSLLFVNFEDVLCVLGAQSNNSNIFFCM